jgi:CHAT domain-containing protein/tetratricopeptide (TPR) repeat protein
MTLSIVRIFLVYLVASGGWISDQIFGSDSQSLKVKALVEADKYESAGDFQAAIRLLEEAHPSIRSRDDQREEFQILFRLGLLNWDIGQLETSAAYYRRAIEIGKSTPYAEDVRIAKIALEIHAFYSTGKNARVPGKYSQSVDAFERAITLAKRIPSQAHELKCLRQLSITYWEMNDLEKYVSLNNQALAIARAIKHRKEEGICLNNIGLFYWKKSDYSKALRYFQQALDIAEKIKDIETKSLILTNMSLIYVDFNEFTKALHYLEGVLKIDREFKRDFYISIDLNNMGIIYRNLAELTKNIDFFGKSISCYEESIIIARQINNKNIECNILTNLGEVNFSLSNLRNAIDNYKLALKYSYDNKDYELSSLIYSNLGKCYLSSNRNNDAINNFQKSISLAREHKSDKILWEAYFGVGQCYEKNNNFESALEYYEKSVAIIDKIRNQIRLDTYKSGYTRNKSQVFERLINLLFKLRFQNSAFDEKIYENVEKAKARALLDSLEESKIDIQEGFSPVQREDLGKASTAITSISLDLSKIGLSPKIRADLNEKLSNEEDRYMMLISKIREENPVLGNIIAPRPASLPQINQFLDEQTGLFEYFLGEQQSLLLCVTRAGVEIFDLPSRGEIENSIKGWIKYLSAQPTGKVDNKLVGKRIFREILFPLKTRKYDKLEKIIIIPDGVLYYLPFETLAIDRAGKDDQFLIEKYRISYAPSASALLSLRSIWNSGIAKMKGLLAFGDPCYPSYKRSDKSAVPGDNLFAEIFMDSGFNLNPLPFARREIMNAAKHFPEDLREIYLGEQAREEVVKKAGSRSYQIVHFACHGFIDDLRPIRSALILSQGDGTDEDGFLQVRELYNLRLSANLVILSACQTGKGTLEKGEGLLGLPRIFFHTGAASVISSLWAVNDQSTAFFMKKLYEKLARGYPKAEALTLTKRDMILSRFGHPYYWAAFVLNGEPDSSIVFH